MIQPSLTFLTMPIPAAMKTLGSFRSFDDLPDLLSDGLIDMTEALMNCFPEAAEMYHRLHDAPENWADFNHAEEALRLLTPAVDAAIYPLSTEHGTMSGDTPLTVALAPGNAMDLLQDCVGLTENINTDAEWEALYELTERLLEDHPSLKASIEQRFDDEEPDFDFFTEAYRGMTEANKAAKPQLALAA